MSTSKTSNALLASLRERQLSLLGPLEPVALTLDTRRVTRDMETALAVPYGLIEQR